MSFTKVIVHAVWGTRNRQPFLNSDIRPRVIQHIQWNIESKNIYVHAINGHGDHLHCLLTLNTDMSLAKTLQLMKGESSFWINKNRLTSTRFNWADEYFACSVSDSDLVSVRDYIDRQEEHAIRTFHEEYEELMKSFRLEISPSHTIAKDG